MRKRFMMLMVAGVLGVGLAPAASADTYRVAQDDTAASEDDDGTDYGWIGLLGLAGLAGLMGPNGGTTSSTESLAATGLTS